MATAAKSEIAPFCPKILEVVVYPHAFLRRKVAKVETFDEILQQDVANMLETMYPNNGGGLAANQVCIDKRIIVMDWSKTKDKPVVMINPVMVSSKGEDFDAEGCLSLPGIYPRIKRPHVAHMRFQDVHGKEHEQTFTGIEAHCCSHEGDHLDGVLSIDYLSPLKRNLAIKKMNKTIREMKKHASQMLG